MIEFVSSKISYLNISNYTIIIVLGLINVKYPNRAIDILGGTGKKLEQRYLRLWIHIHSKGKLTLYFAKLTLEKI